MENVRTVEGLIKEINALTTREKKHLFSQLNQSAPLSELQLFNEKQYSTTPVSGQTGEPTTMTGKDSKALPERYEPSHQDIDKIFGGFQSSQSAEELVEELYRLRTTGTERAALNE